MAYYYCPNCGASNADTVTACYNCGAPNPNLLATDPAQAGGTSPFEAPTQPQSPYQSPSYPPPMSPSVYGMPPASQTSPLPPTMPYAPPAYGQIGYESSFFLAEAARLKSQARNALILGIVATLCCGLLGPVALALGIHSRNGLQRLGVSDGQSLAIVGIALGGVATAGWLLLMLVNLVSK